MSVLRRHDLFSSDSEGEDRIRHEIIVRPRINFQVSNQFQFKEKFRLRYEEVEYVLSQIGNRLRHKTLKNNALTPEQRLLSALHWLGSGSQYHAAGDMHGISKATLCRNLKEVITAINETLFQTVVRWPEDCSDLATDFFQKGGFPNVCGCVDGILINIVAPHHNEEQYVDRHGKHSINVMAICGPDLQFYHATARWPGAVHDSRVMRNSTISRRFSQGWRPFPNALILGDSAYKLHEWLITPWHENPLEESEQAFNARHKSCRRLIECAFGVLKKRFSCLNLLRVNPNYASKIITACMTLHNVATKMDFEWSAQEIYLENEGLVLENNNAGMDPRGIAKVRELLAFFT